jgi:hypothetical protein
MRLENQEQPRLFSPDPGMVDLFEQADSLKADAQACATQRSGVEKRNSRPAAVLPGTRAERGIFI